MSKTLECVNCHNRTTDYEAKQRNFRTGNCGKCGAGLAEVVDGLPHKIATDLDKIFNETYLPIAVRTELEKLIVKYADVQVFNGKKQAYEHIKKDLSNYGVTEADYVMSLYANLLKEEAGDGR